MLNTVITIYFSLKAVVSQLTSSHQNPSIANETSDLTLTWKYSISSSIILARVGTITGGGFERIVRRVGGGDIMVEAKYQDRCRANITDSQAWLKILQVQRSDKGMYEFQLEPVAGNSISSQLELIVHCKYLPWLIQSSYIVAWFIHCTYIIAGYIGPRNKRPVLTCTQNLRHAVFTCTSG